MYNILVPVDFSRMSCEALNYAINLFGKEEIKITILNTYRSHSSAFHMRSLDQVLEIESRREMDAIIERLEKDHPKVRLKPLIVKADAVSAIASMGDSGKYDLIVMGTKGASGLKEVFVGSVAGGVIAGTSAPVLVVPADYAFEPVRKIVLAIGDIPLADSAVADPLRMMIRILKCEVEVIHVTDENDNDIEDLLKPFQDLDFKLNIAQGSGDVNRHLNTFLVKSGAGMLCLIRSKRGFFNRIFQESVTLKQTFDSPVPLLVLHN